MLKYIFVLILINLIFQYKPFGRKTSISKKCKKYKEYKEYNDYGKLYDIVYTWVDSTDVNWQRQYSKYYPSKYSNNRHDSNNFLIGISLTQARRYLKDVRNIYIIVDDIQVDRAKRFTKEWDVIIVPHSTIIDKKYLPLFNSRPIEASISNIKGVLNDVFYLNDDFIPIKQITYDDLFGKDRYHTYKYIIESDLLRFIYKNIPKFINDKVAESLYKRASCEYEKSLLLPSYKLGINLANMKRSLHGGVPINVSYYKQMIKFIGEYNLDKLMRERKRYENPLHSYPLMSSLYGSFIESEGLFESKDKKFPVFVSSKPINAWNDNPYLILCYNGISNYNEFSEQDIETMYKLEPGEMRHIKSKFTL